jgi:prefoldin subunit 5
MASPEEERASEAGTESAAEEAYVGTYKDREAAEKGLLEKDKHIGHLQSELDALKKAQSGQDTQTELLKKMADIAEKQASGPKEGPSAEERLKAMQSELAEAWGKSDDDGARKTLEFMSLYAADQESRIGKRLESELSEREQKMMGMLEDVQKRLRDVDPEAPPRATMTEVAEEFGLDLDDDTEYGVAVKLAKKKISDSDNERHELPGGMGGGGTVGSGTKKTFKITDEFLAQLGMKRGDLSPEDWKALEKKWGSE